MLTCLSYCRMNGGADNGAKCWRNGINGLRLYNHAQCFWCLTIDFLIICHMLANDKMTLGTFFSYFIINDIGQPKLYLNKA